MSKNKHYGNKGMNCRKEKLVETERLLIEREKRLLSSYSKLKELLNDVEANMKESLQEIGALKGEMNVL